MYLWAGVADSAEGFCRVWKSGWVMRNGAGFYAQWNKIARKIE